jgi:hypothetical protein
MWIGTGRAILWLPESERPRYVIKTELFHVVQLIVHHTLNIIISVYIAYEIS